MFVGFFNCLLLVWVWLNVVEGYVLLCIYVVFLVGFGGEVWIVDVGFGGSFVLLLWLMDGVEGWMFDGVVYCLCVFFEGVWLLECVGLFVVIDGRVVDYEDW